MLTNANKVDNDININDIKMNKYKNDIKLLRRAALQFMHYYLSYKHSYKSQTTARFNGLADDICVY